MLSRKDAEEAEINVVHPDLTQFRARQMHISVEHSRFTANCEAIHRNIVRDLVLTCFGRVLVHSPIRMMGLNRALHFDCGSEAKRSEFGFRLAPLDPWGKWGEEIKNTVATNQQHGGMMSIQMREWPRPDKRIGYIQAEIQPSKSVRNNSGIFIQINNHFEFEPDGEHPARKAMDTLEEEWERAAAKADEIIGEVMLKAVGNDKHV